MIIIYYDDWSLLLWDDNLQTIPITFPEEEWNNHLFFSLLILAGERNFVCQKVCRNNLEMFLSFAHLMENSLQSAFFLLFSTEA